MTKRRADMTPAEKERACELRRAAYQRKREQELAYAAKYRDENRERINAYARERSRLPGHVTTTERRKTYTPEQREAELAYKRQHYKETREQQLAYAAQYRADNYDRLREGWVGGYARRKDWYDEYRAKNASRIAEQRAAWKEANRERIAAVQAAWMQANLDKHRTYQHNRRARKLDNGGTLSPDIVQRLFRLQRGKCACCRQPLGGSYDLDHIVPLALGGPNSDDNVQLLRARCNRQKGAKHPVEFMQTRGMLL